MDASQARNPAALPDSSPEKQSELKLNVGIGTIGTILSLFVTIVFIAVIDELVLGIVFAVVTVVSAAITLYVFNRKRRGAAAAARSESEASSGTAAAA
jgi:cbb3-type cytochrome oxidase subunit 3